MSVENRKCYDEFAPIKLVVNRGSSAEETEPTESAMEELQDYKVLLLICVNCHRKWDQDKVGNFVYSNIPEGGNNA